MIEFLSGKIKCRETTNVILDISGVGYGVEVPLTTLCELPKGSEVVDLWIYTRVREDALKLYGFLKKEDRQAFEVLLKINGVGPKVALAIMSTLTVSTLIYAAESNQPEIIQVVPGIGKSKAEKILVELKSKVSKLLPKDAITPMDQKLEVLNFVSTNENFSYDQNIMVNDLHLALENLGYKQKDISSVIKQVVKGSSSNDFGDLMKVILTELAQNKGKSKRKTDKKTIDTQTTQLEKLF